MNFLETLKEATPKNTELVLDRSIFSKESVLRKVYDVRGLSFASLSGERGYTLSPEDIFFEPIILVDAGSFEYLIPKNRINAVECSPTLYIPPTKYISISLILTMDGVLHESYLGGDIVDWRNKKFQGVCLKQDSGTYKKKCRTELESAIPLFEERSKELKELSEKTLIKWKKSAHKILKEK